MSDMPILDYSLTIPFPGYVDIDINGMKMRFSKASVNVAVANIKAKRQTFANEAAYRNTLNMYEAALKLLEEAEA